MMCFCYFMILNYSNSDRTGTVTTGIKGFKINCNNFHLITHSKDFCSLASSSSRYACGSIFLRSAVKTFLRFVRSCSTGVPPRRAAGSTPSSTFENPQIHRAVANARDENHYL